MGREGSFADELRKLIRTMGTMQPVAAADLAAELDDLPVGKKGSRKLHSTLCELMRLGDVVRAAPGWYMWQGRKKEPSIQERMWRVLRCRRSVTIEDLMELAGAKKYYAQEFMDHLVRSGHVRKTGRGKTAHWALVKDTVRMPESKQARQRRLARCPVSRGSRE